MGIELDKIQDQHPTFKDHAIQIKRGTASLGEIFGSSATYQVIYPQAPASYPLEIYVNKKPADYTKSSTIAVAERNPVKDFQKALTNIALSECYPVMDDYEGSNDLPIYKPVIDKGR